MVLNIPEVTQLVRQTPNLNPLLTPKPVIFPWKHVCSPPGQEPQPARKQPFMESTIMILHYDIDQYLMILIILLSSVRIKNMESITLNLQRMKNSWCYVPRHLQDSYVRCEKSQEAIRYMFCDKIFIAVWGKGRPCQGLKDLQPSSVITALLCEHGQQINTGSFVFGWQLLGRIIKMQ